MNKCLPLTYRNGQPNEQTGKPTDRAMRLDDIRRNQ